MATNSPYGYYPNNGWLYKHCGCGQSGSCKCGHRFSNRNTTNCLIKLQTPSNFGQQYIVTQTKQDLVNVCLSVFSEVNQTDGLLYRSGRDLYVKLNDRASINFRKVAEVIIDSGNIVNDFPLLDPYSNENRIPLLTYEAMAALAISLNAANFSNQAPNYGGFGNQGQGGCGCNNQGHGCNGNCNGGCNGGQPQHHHHYYPPMPLPFPNPRPDIGGGAEPTNPPIPPTPEPTPTTPVPAPEPTPDPAPIGDGATPTP